MKAWVTRARIAVLIVLCLALLLAGFALRTLLSGRAALDLAEQAFDRGELRESVRQARRAATFFVPGAPHVGAAYGRLIVIARGAEAVGRPQLAAFAWSAVRSAAIESAAPGYSARAELELANRNLARLSATSARNRPGDDGDSERQLLRKLASPPEPSSSGLFLYGAGLLLAIFGLAWMAAFGFRREGRLRKEHALASTVIFAIGAACWTLAAYRG